MEKWYEFTGFSDEIDENIDVQFAHLNALSIRFFEPRGIDGKNIADLSYEEAVSLKKKMDAAGISASSIGSPIGKIGITEDFDAHLEKLKSVIKTAKILGTKYIRIFSFYIPDGKYDEYRAEVLRRMKAMAALGEKEGVILLHENEKGIYGDIAPRCLEILEEVNSPALRAVFDPANFVQCGQKTYPEAYELLKKHIVYMHIKDALSDGDVVPAGAGIGHVPEILRALKESGYEGFLSLEPHLGAFTGLSGLSLSDSDRLSEKEKSSADKFDLAYRSLNNILERINTMNEVRFGIIGLGNMGTSHAKNVFGGKVPGMVLTAIADISPARRDFAKENFPGVEIFEKAEDLMDSGLTDTVIVAVPHYDHARYVMAALDKGLNVITEKPAGVYTKQVKEMNARAAKSDKLFGIMYNQRTNPVYQKLREIVQSGELGNIKRVTWIITNWYRTQAYHDSSTWRSTWKTEGGGALINQNPHQLDLWQWMFGVPDRIYARCGFGKYRDIEVEDDVMAYFEYDNGMTGEYITATGEAPGTNRLEVASDMGKIVIENDTMTFYKNEMPEPEFNRINELPFGVPKCEAITIDVDNSGGEQHVGILKNFTGALLNGTPLLAPGEEGIKGLTISNAIHLSAWTGEVVDVKNFPDDRYYDILQEKIKNSTVVKKESQVIQSV